MDPVHFSLDHQQPRIGGALIERRAADPRFAHPCLAYVHIDGEMTGLDVYGDEIWQLAFLVDGPTGCFHGSFAVEHDAEPSAWTLEKTAYRAFAERGAWVPRRAVALALKSAITMAGGDRAVCVGVNVDFDYAFLTALLRRLGMAQFFDYHKIKVEEGVKYMLDLPISPGLDTCAELLGLTRVGTAHDADSDMLLAREIHASVLAASERLATARQLAERRGDAEMAALLSFPHVPALFAA